MLKATGILVRGAKERTLAQVTADAMEDAEKKDRDLERTLDAVCAVAASNGFGRKFPSVKEYLEEYVPYGGTSENRPEWPPHRQARSGAFERSCRPASRSAGFGRCVARLSWNSSSFVANRLRPI